MPAHAADCSDPANWENPPVPRAWWDTIRATMPAFDPATTPTGAIGVIPEQFRTWPKVLRSNHPTASFASRGPLAKRITAVQKLEDPLGEGSPLAALYDLRAWILLLGVGHDSNTILHLAERRALGADQEQVQNGAPLLIDGVRQWVPFSEPDLDEDDLEEVGSAFERTDTTIRKSRVGTALATLLPAQPLVDFAGR